MWNLFIKIRQHFCKHKFVKHYDTECECYVYRCTKCNKVIKKHSEHKQFKEQVLKNGRWH